MKEIKDYTKLFKEGDIVYHFKLGECEVVKIFDDETHPMCIRYNHKPSGDKCSMHIDKEVISSLSFRPYDFDNLDRFTRNRPVKDKTVVFVRYSESGKWFIRRTFKDNPFITGKIGKTHLRCYAFQSLSEIEKKPHMFNDYPIWSFDMPDFDEEDSQQGI